MSLLSRFLERKAVLTLLPNLELYQWGREAIVPAGEGIEVYAPYFVDQSDSAGSLAEATALANSNMSAGNFSGTLAEYPKSFEFTRFFWSTKSIPILAETTRQLMVSIAKGWESKIQSVISDGGPMSAASWVSPDTATTYTNIKESTKIKAGALSKASKVLASKYVPGYQHLAGEYAGVFHPNATHHLRTNLSGGTHISPESQSMNMTDMFRRKTAGSLFNIRIHESAWSAKSIYEINGMSEGCSGYLNYIFGPESFFVSPLANGRPEIIMHGFGSGGSSDPANRKATLAAYSVFTAFAGKLADRCVQIPVGYL